MSYLTDSRTPAEHLADMLAKRRAVSTNDAGHVVGQDHHRAKLTDHDVWLINELKAEGLSYRQIAIKFGVSRSTVESICQGRRRAHIATGQKLART